MTGKTLIERLRRVLVIEYVVPSPVLEELQRAADEREEAADGLERLQALAQAAGYTDAGEALKAIPVKQKALTWALSMLGVVPMDEATLSQFDNARAAWKIGEPA